MFKKIELQQLIFNPNVTRTSLTDIIYDVKPTKNLKINVWRNHNFEMLVPLIKPFLWYQELEVTFNIKDYDDSLSFFNYDKHSDIEIIWLDPRNITNKKLDDWLVNRIYALKELSNNPIILCSWYPIKNCLDNLAEVYFINIEELAKIYDKKFLDNAKEKLIGSPIHWESQKLIAKTLACHYIPNIVYTPIKAICLDLDNTLYNGILGEDGIEALTLTENHKYLQHLCKKLFNSGIFLIIVSKNNIEDIQKLFEIRKDFILKISDFTFIEASWESKSSSIASIIKKLNILENSILFVDDNIGELYEVYEKFPSIQVLLANNHTAHCLDFYPGLKRLQISNTDLLRNKDLISNQKREKILTKNSIEDYFKSLNIQINFSFNNKSHLDRLHELCYKTNQFNLAVKRYKKSVIEKKINDENNEVISIAVSDNISDSGIVGLIIGNFVEDTFIVTEICLSCRVLGRKLENLMLLTPLVYLLEQRSIKKIKFEFSITDRNEPAINWLKTIIKNLNCTTTTLYRLKEFKTSKNVNILFEDYNEYAGP